MGKAVHQLVEMMLNDVNVMLGADVEHAFYSVENPKFLKKNAWYMSEV